MHIAASGCDEIPHPVEVWRRRQVEVEELIGDAALELETVGITIPFAAIYADSGG